MKQEFVRADHDPEGNFRFSCVLTIENIPNWFEKVILGHKPYYSIYKGDCTTWYKLPDMTRASYYLEVWLCKQWQHWCWENWL